MLVAWPSPVCADHTAGANSSLYLVSSRPNSDRCTALWARRSNPWIHLHPDARASLDAAIPLMARLLVKLEPRLLVPQQGRDHRPGTGIDLRVLDARLIVDGIGVDHRVPLHDAEVVAEEIAGIVDPGESVRVPDVDHEGVPLP